MQNPFGPQIKFRKGDPAKNQIQPKSAQAISPAHPKSKLFTHMINLSRSSRDLALHSLGQIIVIALRHGGLLLGRPGEREPDLRPQNGRNPLPYQLLQRDRVGQSRYLEGRLEGNPVRDLRLQVPIGALAGLESPPHAALLPDLLPHLVQDIDVVHITFHGEPVQVLELHGQIGPPGMDARPQDWDLGLQLEGQVSLALRPVHFLIFPIDPCARGYDGSRNENGPVGRKRREGEEREKDGDGLVGLLGLGDSERGEKNPTLSTGDEERRIKPTCPKP